jgi:hypothetical protein
MPAKFVLKYWWDAVKKSISYSRPDRPAGAVTTIWLSDTTEKVGSLAVS